MSGKGKDITNQRFGKLTALYPTDKRTKEGNVVWHCICDCGNETDVGSSSLRKGNTQSCGGSWGFENLVGKTFGLLTVIEQISSDKHNGRKWLCRCECGNTTELYTKHLTTGIIKSCGCLKSEDLTGQVFGKLTVLGWSDKRGSRGSRTVPLWE